jgi:hypothetical protein
MCGKPLRAKKAAAPVSLSWRTGKPYTPKALAWPTGKKAYRLIRIRFQHRFGEQGLLRSRNLLLVDEGKVDLNGSVVDLHTGIQDGR